MKVYVKIVPPPEPTKKDIAEMKRQARVLMAQNPNLPVRKNTPVILDDNADPLAGKEEDGKEREVKRLTLWSVAVVI